MSDDKLRREIDLHARAYALAIDSFLPSLRMKQVKKHHDAILAMFDAEREKIAELIKAFEAPGCEGHNCANSKCLAAQKRRLAAIEKARAQ